MTERWYCDTRGIDDTAVRDGFQWLINAAAPRSPKLGGVFVPTMDRVETLETAIGDRAASLLRRSGRILEDEVEIELLTTSRHPASFSGPILALWVDDEKLDALDDMTPSAICAIPWGDIDGWKENWNPTELRSGRSSGHHRTITNRVVEAAMLDLTMLVDVETGLKHPNDRALAAQMFRALRDGGEAFRPAEIRAYAVRHGWRSKDARKLGELGQTVLDHRGPEDEPQTMWAPDIVEQWRARRR